jgi:hypothetical protein
MFEFARSKPYTAVEPTVRHHPTELPSQVSHATFLCMFRTGQVAMRFDVIDDKHSSHVIHIVPNGALFRDALLRFARSGKTKVEVFRPDGTSHTYTYGV